MSAPSDLLDFILRWRGKARSYPLDKTQACFDAFFSHFVLYNFLYDYFHDERPELFPEPKRDKGDRFRAVNVAFRILGAEAVSSDGEVRRCAEAIKAQVMSGEFYIRETRWDADRVAGLSAVEADVWTSSILDILYQIRCNTFHGRKPFNRKQLPILGACIGILCRLNDMLIERIAPGKLTEHDAKPAQAEARHAERRDAKPGADRRGM